MQDSSDSRGVWIPLFYLRRHSRLLYLALLSTAALKSQWKQEVPPGRVHVGRAFWLCRRTKPACTPEQSKRHDSTEVHRGTQRGKLHACAMIQAQSPNIRQSRSHLHQKKKKIFFTFTNMIKIYIGDLSLLTKRQKRKTLIDSPFIFKNINFSLSFILFVLNYIAYNSTSV